LGTCGSFGQSHSVSSMNKDLETARLGGRHYTGQPL
jgi:hypothetical protein